MLPLKGLKITSNVVCKLNHALYGLRQTAHSWNKCL